MGDGGWGAVVGDLLFSIPPTCGRGGRRHGKRTEPTPIQEFCTRPRSEFQLMPLRSQHSAVLLRRSPLSGRAAAVLLRWPPLSGRAAVLLLRSSPLSGRAAVLWKAVLLRWSLLPGRTARLWKAVMLPALAVVFAGCLPDANHSNPLDPRSDEYEEAGAVEGMATRFYPPYTPVEGAEVRLTPGPHIVESRADGSFAFEEIPIGTYSITAVKEGFASFPDTVTVSLGNATSEVRLRLNGLPVVRTFDLRTIHVSRWWPQEDLYMLEIVADLEDPDGVGDVAAAWVEIPSYDLSRPLAPTGVVGRYRLALSADSLPAPSLHAMQGTEMVLHVEDAAGFVVESAPKTIVRVIDEVPLAEEPQGLSTVEDGRPNLIWEDAGLPFSFTYRVDIVRDEANVQTVVATITDISSDITSHQIETPLASGTYFWTISVVDTFGNRSRSKEAGFVVP